MVIHNDVIRDTSPTETAPPTGEVRPPRAVLFDLYGTLAPGGDVETRDRVSRSVAEALGVDSNDFTEAINGTFHERLCGDLGGLPETLTTLAARFAVIPTEAGLELAIERRLALTRSLFEATWALPVLDEIRRRGLPIGLVTDCSVETRIEWPSADLYSRFDAAAFSCDVGVRKPDARMYLEVTDALGVSPADCLYVGDGASHELTGATDLGMRAIRLDHDVDRPFRTGDAAEWPGETVTELAQVLGLLDGARARSTPNL